MTYYEIKAYVSCNKKIIEKCEITREKIIKFNSLYFELSKYLRSISMINDKFCFRYNVNNKIIIYCFVGGENADIGKIKRKFLKKLREIIMTIYIIKIRKNGIKLNATKIQHKVEKIGSNSSGKVTRIYVNKNGIKTFYSFSGFSCFNKDHREIIYAFVGKDNEDLKKIKIKLMNISNKIFTSSN